jgi:hypothetical protein
MPYCRHKKTGVLKKDGIVPNIKNIRIRRVEFWR